MYFFKLVRWKHRRQLWRPQWKASHKTVWFFCSMSEKKIQKVIRSRNRYFSRKYSFRHVKCCIDYLAESSRTKWWCLFVECHKMTKKQLFRKKITFPRFVSLKTQNAVLTTLSENFCQTGKDTKIVFLSKKISFSKMLPRTSEMNFWQPCQKNFLKAKNFCSMSKNDENK